MAIIDITSEIYSDVTYTRTITARQLLEIPANKIVALKVADREYGYGYVWVRLDEIGECRHEDGRLSLVRVKYDDRWMGNLGTDQYFYPNQKLQIALVG